MVVNGHGQEARTCFLLRAAESKIFVTHALYRIDGKNELSPLATLLSTIQAANDQVNSMDSNFRFVGCFDTSTQAQGRHSRFSNLEVRE